MKREDLVSEWASIFQLRKIEGKEDIFKTGSNAHLWDVGYVLI